MFGQLGTFIFPGSSGGSSEKIPCSPQAWFVSNVDEACGSPGHNSSACESTVVPQVGRAIIYGSAAMILLKQTFMNRQTLSTKAKKIEIAGSPKNLYTPSHLSKLYLCLLQQ